MVDPLKGLKGAVASLEAAWRGSASPGAVPESARELGRRRLVAVTEALGAVGRHLDALRAGVAAEVERECRPELGPDSLAKREGFRNGAALTAATGGISTGDAGRLAKVGRAVEPRTGFGGQALPATRRHVADALRAGRIGAPAAALIVGMLDRVGPRAGRERADEAERVLVRQAGGLSLDQVRRAVEHAEAWLAPDGIEASEQERREARELYLEERAGVIRIRGQIDTVTAAPIKAAIEAMVTARMRAARDDAGGLAAGGSSGGAERMSVPQMQADALAALAEHALGCDNSGLPLDASTTVIVRMDLETLREGVGLAEVDGVAAPASASAARKLAAAADVIPVVLGGDSEILDWGRRRRSFTRAQKLALVERDGGCAMCGLPPGMTAGHHLNWWDRDRGPTDLSNGILLCTSCHHRIHDNGWDIRIDGAGTGARVWFIPPRHVDPARTPRLGGRARYKPRIAA